MALNASCDEIYGSRVRRLEPFSVRFLPANQNHAVVFSNADTQSFGMEVAPEWLEQAKDCSLTLDRPVFCRAGSLSRLFISLYREFLIMDPASAPAIEGLALEMLAEVSRHPDKVLEQSRPQWMVQVMDLLHAQFCDGLTIAEIAGTVGVHPMHLARAFRRSHGCTVGDYIRRLRIQRACWELLSSKETLAVIAAGIGFADQSHFTRTFKRLVGMTPGAYRTFLSC